MAENCGLLVVSWLACDSVPQGTIPATAHSYSAILTLWYQLSTGVPIDLKVNRNQAS